MNDIIMCPHCKTRVLPSKDGICPSCKEDVASRRKRVVTSDDILTSNDPPVQKILTRNNAFAVLFILLSAANLLPLPKGDSWIRIWVVLALVYFALSIGLSEQPSATKIRAASKVYLASGLIPILGIILGFLTAMPSIGHSIYYSLLVIFSVLLYGAFFWGYQQVQDKFTESAYSFISKKRKWEFNDKGGKLIEVSTSPILLALLTSALGTILKVWVNKDNLPFVVLGVMIFFVPESSRNFALLVSLHRVEKHMGEKLTY